jgi:hypothetical protein
VALLLSPVSHSYIKENRKAMLLKDYEESSPVYRRMAH